MMCPADFFSLDNVFFYKNHLSFIPKKIIVYCEGVEEKKAQK